MSGLRRSFTAIKSDIKPKIFLFHPHSPNRNISPPLNLALIGAVLIECGCEVRAIDASAVHMDNWYEKAKRSVEEFRPDAIGISLHISDIHITYRTIKELFVPLNVAIIAGGAHATLLPEEALENGVDIVVRGEGEFIVKELVKWLKGEKELSEIRGISYVTENGYVQHNPNTPLVEDLDSLPLPAHELFSENYYFTTESEKNRAGKILSSRGCPNKCTFCANSVFGRKFRYRSPSSILMEMEKLRSLYGVEHFEFIDDAFTANRKRLLELCGELRKVKWATFSCVARLENLDDETVPAMRAGGCELVNIGVESARKESLKRIKKNINLDKLLPTLELLKKNGIKAALFFMFGFPWETAEEMRETNRFIEKLKPLVYWFSEGGVVTPYPGTELYEEYHLSVGFTKWWLTLWQPPCAEKLHPLQPYYFFPYDEEKKQIIREALNMIFEHNRKDSIALERAHGEIEWLKRIIADLEKEIRARDTELRKLWEKSLLEKLRKFLREFSK